MNEHRENSIAPGKADRRNHSREEKEQLAGRKIY